MVCSNCLLFGIKRLGNPSLAACEEIKGGFTRMYRDNCTAHLGCQPSSQNTQDRDINLSRGASSHPKEGTSNKAKPTLELLFLPQRWPRSVLALVFSCPGKKDPDFRVCSRSRCIPV